MQRAKAVVGSAVFLVVAPGTVAGLVPYLLSRWHVVTWAVPLRVLGIALLAAGAPILLDSFARFALQGLGTPAPAAPPKHLVVTGLYRFVRNPMYVAVVSLILGQGLVLGSVRVLEYGAIVYVIFYIFVVAYEEPTLREKFGDEYKEYCANVRRFWPRVIPWRAAR